EVFHCVMHTAQFAPGQLERTRHRGTRRHNNSVVTTSQFSPAQVTTDLNPATEASPLCLELRYPTFDQRLLDFELREAVAQTPPGLSIAFEHGHGVPPASQLLRRR